MRSGLPLMVLLIGLLIAPGTLYADADFALIASSNRSPDPNLPELRYADDDGVAYARLMRDLGARTLLFATPDRDTQTLHPQARIAGPGTLAALQQGFERMAAWTKEAKQSGQRTRAYVFLAAHGDMRNGRPFLQLDDGVLFREDLVQLLRSTGADETHVVVDACYGALFIASRGPGGEVLPVPLGFSAQADAPWPAHTGLIAARSSGEQSHEWSEFQAGVFSHEVRSGLRGAADANLDGRVSYRELSAFVERANAGVPNVRFRPQIAVRAPQGDLDAALADLRRAPLVMELDLPYNGHLVVESAQGVRLADAHPDASTRVKLYLGDDDALFVRRERPPLELRVEAHAGHVALSSLRSGAPAASTRGAAHEAFRHLFALPFAASVARDYVPPPDEPIRAAKRPIEVSLEAGAAALIGDGGYAGTGYGGTLTMGRRLRAGFSLRGRFAGHYFGSAFVDSKDVRNYILEGSLQAIFAHRDGRMRVEYGPALGGFFHKERFFLHREKIFTPEELAQSAPERASRDTTRFGIQAGLGVAISGTLGPVRLGPALDASLLIPLRGCERSEEYALGTHCKSGGAPTLLLSLGLQGAY